MRPPRSSFCGEPPLAGTVTLEMGGVSSTMKVRQAVKLLTLGKLKAVSDDKVTASKPRFCITTGT